MCVAVFHAYMTSYCHAAGGVNIEPSIVNGLCFALSGILASGDPAHRRFFLVPIAIFVCIVLPQLPKSDAKGIVSMRTVQNVAVALATGLLITGVLFKSFSECTA